MRRVAVFASGSGSNAENLIQYFAKSDIARITHIVCNNPKAGVVERANRLRIPLLLIGEKSLQNPHLLLHNLLSEKVDTLVLAGFLKLLPEKLIEEFPKSVFNLHPALLPAFGGKGMYGDRVHKAVLQSGVRISGITIHRVDNQYDTGEIIAQFSCHVDASDSVESLAKKIHELEYQHFPATLERVFTE